MSQEDPDSTDDQDAADSSASAGPVDALLRALSHAPRPAALQLEHAALPEAVARDLADERRSSPPAPRCGDIVDGRYRIDDTLGSGGMGVVFGATQLATGRKVALKWMQLPGAYRTQTECEQAFQRFLREAQAAGRIRHPNVVDVYDAGKDPLMPYLVMERLEGETLRALMDRGPLSWGDALTTLLPAMRGVSEAHRRGVVHRDLKPDNVFLAREGDGFVPKVLDFGVSRLRPNDELSPEMPSLTRTGTVLGTPSYMPLEQLRAVGIDARTDVYALGVVLYEMLAGKRPYEARNAADFAALLACEKPTPLTRHRPDLRGPREAVVMKALARAPGERHADVAAFADALSRASHERPRGLVWLAVGTLLATALVGWLYSARPTPEEVRTRPLATRVENPREEPPTPSARAATAPNTASAAAPSDPPPPPVSPRRRSKSVPVASSPNMLPPAGGEAGPRRNPASLDQADFQSASVLPAARRPEPARPSLSLGREQF